ncbi:MAG TPA: hypothetical protein VF796_17315 [Humisphaera sp.]
MSWEAHRWTARTPSELYHTLGPHGVDDLVRQMIAACWRTLPNEGRTLALGVAAARTVYDRNVGVWKKIKKPTPEQFFADLFLTDADGYCRQAMVLTWMMMPRTGGREVPDALKIFGRIFERNVEAWEEDDATFTGKTRKPAKAAVPAKAGVPAKKGKAGKKPETRSKKPRKAGKAARR